MLHKFVDTNVIPFFFLGQNGCSFWGRENSNKQSLQLRLRMGKKSHMKMPQMHWRGLSISIQPCKLVMVIGQLKMLAHCHSSFHPWWVSSLNSMIVINTSWNTNYFCIIIYKEYISTFLDPLKHKLFNLVIWPSDYLDKLFRFRLK